MHAGKTLFTQIMGFLSSKTFHRIFTLGYQSQYASRSGIGALYLFKQPLTQNTHRLIERLMLGTATGLKQDKANRWRNRPCH